MKSKMLELIKNTDLQGDFLIVNYAQFLPKLLNYLNK